MNKIVPFLLLGLGLFACTKPPRFELLDPKDTGISFNNRIVENDSFNIMHFEYMYNGGGVGVGDLNNDGLQDLIFVGNKVSTRIYLNLGDFKFTDITKNFEGLDSSQWLSGVSVTDINADGLADVYLTSTMSNDSIMRKNKLWVNQGLSPDKTPVFKEMSESYGVGDPGYSMQAAFFDYDLDGDLDLYVLNNIVNKQVPTNYREKIIDGSSINNDQLYNNLGNGKFKNVTLEAGIVYEGFGLGLAMGDFNKDGYPDIYVSNDYISNDLLYINQRNGTFLNESRKYISYQSRFSMGNDAADINNDGNLDMMTMDMNPEQYFRKKQTINGNGYIIYINNEKYNYETQYVRNMLHLHNGFINGQMLPFSEVGQMMGIYQTEWSWSPLFADYDNDGDKDLLITNGFPKDLTDKDFTNYKAQVYGSVASDRHMITRIPIVKVPNYAYENTGDYSFSDRTESWGMKIPSFSNGAAFVDLDNDGDLDYAVNNINDNAFLYRNNTNPAKENKSNYIRIQLKGEGANTPAIGSKIELWSNGKYQYAEKFLSRGYISSVDPLIHFGLDGDKAIDSIKITWPAGSKVSLLKQVAPNQILVVEESQAHPLEKKHDIMVPYLFEEAPNVLDYSHTEKDYIDFYQGQNILQHKFSQLGPCLVRGDLDKDGIDDLLVGATSDQPTTVFLRKGGKFIRTELKGLSGEKDCDESDMAILDVDGDGDNDVVSASGGYQKDDENQYKHFLYLNDGGSFSKSELSIPSFCASVIRPVDFDHDGDMDLFIGARVRRGKFPLSHPSHLLRNDQGTYISDKSNSFAMGMVTDANWADFDGDGWQDLMVTREWNSVQLYRNNLGKNLTLVEDKNLESKHGFWTGVTSGDLDNDGDPDFVLGNLGTNHRFTVSDQFPMQVYAVDLDKNGFVDPLTTAYWNDMEGKMQEYPVNYLDELGSQSPFFRKVFTSYTQFSTTTMDQIMKTDTIPVARKFYVNTTKSYVLWNDKGNFTWEELPNPLQVAPVRKMLVRDFNEDGTKDIIVTGNDRTYDVSTGYYEANKGIVMLGQGKRSFEVLQPSRSGLLLNGQVESLVYFEGDTSWLVAGINRRKVAVFRHVKK